jgi:hypothetical protein
LSLCSTSFKVLSQVFIRADHLLWLAYIRMINSSKTFIFISCFNFHVHCFKTQVMRFDEPSKLVPAPAGSLWSQHMSHWNLKPHFMVMVCIVSLPESIVFFLAIHHSRWW